MHTIQYIPFGSLEHPKVMESLIQTDPSTHIVYSTGELVRAIEAEIRIGPYKDSGICPEFDETTPEGEPGDTCR